jgi:hypothetical protein
LIGAISLNKSDFLYTATIKIADLRNCKTKSEFPGITDISINSRTFANYFDCSNSVRAFMDNVVTNLNTELPRDHQYLIPSDANEIYTGIDSKSKEWSVGELARIWMFEVAQEDAVTIQAVGQARVYMMPKGPGSDPN